MGKKLVVIGIGLIFLLLIGYLAAGWYFSSVIIASRVHSFEEDRRNLQISDPEQFGLPEPQEFTITNGDVQLRGWFFEHPQPQACGMVVLHGHTSTRYGSLQSIFPYSR